MTKSQCKRLALGTVQLGIPYGVSNSRGQVPVAEAFDILDSAAQAGIDTLDTARAYGTSECVIGDYFKTRAARFEIVTKISRLTGRPAEQAADDVRASIFALGVPSLPVALLHDETDLEGPGADALWATLMALKAQGLVHKIGVSSYKPERLKEILRRFPLDVVQVPCNLLDRRFISAEMLEAYAQRKVRVFARSVFLQGLFFLNPNSLPAHLAFARKTLARLTELQEASGTSLAAASLGLCLAQDAISKVIIGVTSRSELEDILSWDLPALPAELDEELGGLWKLTSGRILDPASWGKGVGNDA